LGTENDAEPYAVAIQPDGKIVVVGRARVNTALTYAHDEFAIVRYNANGTLDKSFDGDGKKTIRIEDDSIAYAVAIQPDGKIIVAGSDYNGGIIASVNNDFAAVRLNSNGALDPTFGSLGKARITMGATST
jgi:uncharacterized delta-60 repeat protein